MRQKMKPDLDLEAVQAELIEKVVRGYKPGISIRVLAKELNLSPMKIRKILITAGVYSTDMSTAIEEMYRDGRTVAQIASLLGTTTSNVNSYLPYERIIYNMDERSVEADRQARYRQRLKAGDLADKAGVKPFPAIPPQRTNLLTVVVGNKLRKYLPQDAFEGTTDPLARYVHAEDPRNLPDLDRYIWCAELATSGRGRNRKQVIVLESAASGFALLCPIPETGEKLGEMILTAVRDGFMQFCFPEIVSWIT